LLTEKDYSAGETFKVVVDYYWLLNGVRDYTVSIYSKQRIEIVDEYGETNMLYTDNREPTEFTTNRYKSNFWIF